MVAAVIAILVILRIDSMGSGSVDVAHHYALAFRIGEQWQLLPGDATLGEMNVYPRLSHTLAAIVGMLFNSTFLGMQLVALASLALVWCCLVRLLGAIGVEAGIAAVLVLAALVATDYFTLGLQVHGAELAGNYFFAQLAGQAGVMCALGASLHAARRGWRYRSYGVLMAAAAILTMVHLLAALEVLATLYLLIACDLWLSRATVGWRTVAATALLASGSLAVIVLNPAFTAMRSIAENNGDLFMPFLPNRVAMLALCALVLLSAGLALRHWLRRRASGADLVVKYLALYGIGLSLLCMLQMLTLIVRMGSDYAVKKYAFALMSMLFVYVSMGIGLLLAQRRHPGHPVRTWTQWRFGAELLSLCVLFLVTTNWPKAIDTSDVVALERKILTLRDVALAAPAAGKANLVIDLPGQGRMINYMFSIAIAHTPRDIAGADLLVADDVYDYARYTQIVAAGPNGRFGRAKCAANPGASLLVLDAPCVRATTLQARSCSGNFDFSAAGRLDPAMMKGFGEAEPSSRWTAGKRATFSCAAAGAKVGRLFLTPFLPPGQPQQRLAVTVNGVAVMQAVFHQGDPGRVVEFALPDAADGAMLEIALDVPDAVAPKALGLSGDERVLGFAIKSLSFE